MELKDYVLALLEEGKKPEEIQGIKPVRQLDEIHDLVTLYFVNRDAGFVSALRIEQYFPINREMAGVIKGVWELGGYNKEKKCYYSMGKYPVARLPPDQTFVTQKRLDADETYMEDHLAG